MELWDDNRWMDGLHGLWADYCASSTPHNVYRKPDEEREAFSRSCASSLLILGDEGDIRSERVCVSGAYSGSSPRKYTSIQEMRSFAHFSPPETASILCTHWSKWESLCKHEHTVSPIAEGRSLAVSFVRSTLGLSPEILVTHGGRLS